jgi:hypothetical protein
MPDIYTESHPCGTAFCMMGWKAHWDGYDFSNTEDEFLDYTVDWSDVVCETGLLISTDIYSGSGLKIGGILFGEEQKSGPEGLQILINRINWFIRRKERWEAFEKLPDLPKKERWAEYERLAA